MSRYRVRLNRAGMKEMLLSDAFGSHMETVAAPVLSAAENDENPDYVDSLELTIHKSQGRGGRVSARVGAAPGLGTAVEAKRGTLAKAMGVL